MDTATLEELQPILVTPPEIIDASAVSYPLIAVTNEQVSDPAQNELLSMRAENCIKKHVIAAMGIGLIPSAVLDVAGITGIEVKMIRDLARIYNFPFPGKLAAIKVLISLAGSLGPVYVSTSMRSALKGVPLVGHAVYVGLLSATGGVAVYAVGKVFQIHFESGGTFLSKDNSLIRDYFSKKYREGQEKVREYASREPLPGGEAA